MGHIITGLTLRRALVWLPAATYCNTGLYRVQHNSSKQHRQSTPALVTGGAWCDTAKMSVSWQHNLVTRVAEPREMDCRGTSGSTLQLSSGRWLVPFSEIFYSPIAAGDHFRSGIGTIFRIMTDNNPIVHTLKIWFGPPIVNFITMFADPNTRLLTTVDTLLHYQLTNKMISLPAGLTPRRHHSPPDSRG